MEETLGFHGPIESKVSFKLGANGKQSHTLMMDCFICKSKMCEPEKDLSKVTTRPMKYSEKLTVNQRFLPPEH